MYLPKYSASELDFLYSHYGGAARLWYDHPRPVQQSQFITQHVPRAANMTIREIGCASGYLLSRLRTLYKPSQAICNEKEPHPERDPWIALDASMTLATVSSESVDLFVSSHVVEHFSPDDWFPHVARVVKRGGFVFTEVPYQANDPEKGIVRGKYHVTFFNGTTFDATMRLAGFRSVAQKGERWIHRKVNE